MGLIKLSEIRPPKHRIRESYGELEELKASMNGKGLLQPILVRPINSDYELVAGYRRWMAAKELGWGEIEAHIVKLSDKEAYEMALIENIQRKTMDAIEEAHAYHNYTVIHGYGSAKELAQKISKSEPYVVKTIGLLKLPEDIYPHISSGEFKRSHAEEIARLDTSQMTEVIDKVRDAELSVKETSLAVDLMKHGMAPDMAIKTALDFPEMKVKDSKIDVVEAAREEIYLILDKALQDFDFHMKFMPEGDERPHWIQARYHLHQVKDEVIKIRKRFRKEKK